MYTPNTFHKLHVFPQACTLSCSILVTYVHYLMKCVIMYYKDMVVWSMAICIYTSMGSWCLDRLHMCI